MEAIHGKDVSYSGEGLSAVVTVDSSGWSTKQGMLQILKFEGRRSHAPPPLSLHMNANFMERNIPFIACKVVATPAYDCGLGCFGNANKIVDTGKQELSDLQSIDCQGVATSFELFAGVKVWADDDWIHFQRQTQNEPEMPGGWIDHRPLVEIRRSQVNFFSSLDELEAARPKQEDLDSQNSPKPGSTWKLKNFDSWIDEADFVEANASAPAGTRYYGSH
ncbi:hypothetical protein F5B20DRAFT_581895 [Whalleya microplaca]|nr:hypothetical protein F5B20DRAFT_581895 [Whalleya microplaca]